MRYILTDTRTGEIKHQSNISWPTAAYKRSRRPRRKLDTDGLLVAVSVIAGLLVASTLMIP